MKKILIFSLILLTLLGIGGYIFFQSGILKNESVKRAINSPLNNLQNGEDSEGGPEEKQLHPLSIDSLRNGEYPGSDLVVEQTLPEGSNYQRYIASYKSEGLKIYGLLTIPNAEKPALGFPVVIFNHGFIPPTEYRTTERYIAYTDAFSKNEYVLFRPDYRGHGNSEGSAAGGYGSNAYTIDVLNATASVKKLKDVDTKKIGMWGHSMGGHITLRNMVVNKDIKAGVIWGGVVASYPDLINRWRRGASPVPGIATPAPSGARRWRQALVEEYGTPEKNPEFWNSISANSYLKDISGPLQLHHGRADTSVPVEFSETLNEQMKDVGKEVELYTYPGDDHDITNSFGVAIERSVAFFDKYLKN
jgi:uncharacterized protein